MPTLDELALLSARRLELEKEVWDKRGFHDRTVADKLKEVNEQLLEAYPQLLALAKAGEVAEYDARLALPSSGRLVKVELENGSRCRGSYEQGMWDVLCNEIEQVGLQVVKWRDIEDEPTGGAHD